MKCVHKSLQHWGLLSCKAVHHLQCMLPIWFFIAHSLESELEIFIVTGYPACTAHTEEKNAGFVESQNNLGWERRLEVSIPSPCSKQSHFQRLVSLIWASSGLLLNTSRHEDFSFSLESLVRVLSALIDLNGLSSLT